MKDELITFETAKLAKEKGFEEETLHFYTKPNSKMFGIDEHGRAYPIKNTSKKLYTCGKEAALNAESVFFAPTQSLLHKWLREKHNILISVYSNASGYLYEVMKAKSGTTLGHSEYEGDDLDSGTFTTYEKAMEHALEYSLGIIR